jgi:hypothetical protein
MYDDAAVSEGVAVFAPGADRAESTQGGQTDQNTHLFARRTVIGAWQECASRKTHLLAVRIPIPSLHWGGLVSSAFRFLDRPGVDVCRGSALLFGIGTGGLA